MKTLDHEGLITACEQVCTHRDAKNALEALEKEAKSEVQVIINEFPDEKKFDCEGFTITLGDNNHSSQERFRAFLIDQGVDPEIIQAAAVYAKQVGKPKLLVSRGKP